MDKHAQACLERDNVKALRAEVRRLREELEGVNAACGDQETATLECIEENKRLREDLANNVTRYNPDLRCSDCAEPVAVGGCPNGHVSGSYDPGVADLRTKNHQLCEVVRQFYHISMNSLGQWDTAAIYELQAKARVALGPTTAPSSQRGKHAR